MTSIKKLLSLITNIIFPHTCICCSKFTQHQYYSGLCIDCLKSAEEFYIAKNPALNNLIARSSFDTFNSRFIYDNDIAKAILTFKFHDAPEYGKHLATLLKPKALEIENYENCLIVPVPVHKTRLKQRRYNQSSILAKYLAKLLDTTYSNKALQRVKKTPHQTGQSAKIRKNQLKDAFLANQEFVKGKEIILIDDVFTTGSTVNLCAAELKDKGAKKVHVLTIAYTPI